MGAVEDSITRLLRTHEVQTINFHLGGVPIYPKGFQKVASLIENRHIYVSPNIRATGQGAAVYAHAIGVNRVNRLTVPHQNLEHRLNRGLIVHECVHALEDYHRTHLTFMDSEAAAYVAQLLYLKQVYNDEFPPEFLELESSLQAIMFEAFNLATRISPGESISTEAAAGLHNAIRNSSQYGGIADNVVEYDGVDHSHLNNPDSD